MQYTYHTKGTCASRIELEIDNGIITKVKFVNGCNGSLAAVARLVTGQPAAKAKELLTGITCGPRPTSCPDQLSQAIEEALLVQQLDTPSE